MLKLRCGVQRGSSRVFNASRSKESRSSSECSSCWSLRVTGHSWGRETEKGRGRDFRVLTATAQTNRIRGAGRCRFRRRPLVKKAKQTRRSFFEVRQRQRAELYDEGADGREEAVEGGMG